MKPKESLSLHSGYKDGPGNQAQFNYPWGITMGDDGTIYVADKDNHRLRAIILSTGEVRTIAGTGVAGINFYRNLKRIAIKAQRSGFIQAS